MRTSLCRRTYHKTKPNVFFSEAGLPPPTFACHTRNHAHNFVSGDRGKAPSFVLVVQMRDWRDCAGIFPFGHVCHSQMNTLFRTNAFTLLTIALINGDCDTDRRCP